LASDTFQKLKTKYSSIFHAAKFGIATAVGFLITEVILTLGVYAAYHTFTVPSIDSFTATLLEINAIAFGVGVTVAFFLNEKVTVSKSAAHKGVKDTIVALLKYQLVSLAGNLVTIGVQLVLLRTLSVPPTIGNIVGALVSFPLTYFVSMKLVWRLSIVRPDAQPAPQG
jgi:putative flippase GtrA